MGDADEESSAPSNRLGVWIKPWSNSKYNLDDVDLAPTNPLLVDALTMAMVDRSRYVEKKISPKSLTAFLTENKYSSVRSEAATYVKNAVDVHFDVSSTKKVNVIASWLLMNRQTGVPDFVVRGRALVTHADPSSDVTSDEVGGLMFMVHNMRGVLAKPTLEPENYVRAEPIVSTEDRLHHMTESLMTDKADLATLRENLKKQHRPPP